MREQSTPEHEWLHKLIGEWTAEVECSMGPDQPPMHQKGRETVRSLGGLWTIGHGVMEGPEVGESVMTLGFDPRKGQFVGTFTASMMTYLWLYQGSLDADRRILTLDTQGPSFTGDGLLSPYQDIIEFVTNDHRTLKSRYQLPSGEWVHFMTAHYRRV